MNSNLSPIDKELIEEKFKNVRAEINSNHMETTMLLKQILDQAKRTNGRVTVLEEETRFARNITKYPKLTWLAILGAIALVYAENILGFLKTI
jgi:hypothetical protein